ncbi:Copia type Polyprotein [Phytophthora megakarya]|uniref:Copia type Polyprotein n=1 Tax=Phytophthora megakarya TaxID=4795 RepID=A0A225VHV3_9STRA|nr:Copia type Polyprotein [Phytophthora megakarya]
MYLATSTRADFFSVGYLSRFVNNPTKNHYGAVKQILRYLQGIAYAANNEVASKAGLKQNNNSDSSQHSAK